MRYPKEEESRVLGTVIQICIKSSIKPWTLAPKSPTQCQASPVPAAGELEAGSAEVMFVSLEDT